MILDETQRAFVEHNRSAAMITLRPDGTAHAVRVGVGFIDGKLWSSGTRGRVRTRHLRRDPRSTLFVFDGVWQWLTLECRATILEGPEVPAQSVRFFRSIQPPRPDGRLTWFGRDVAEAELLQIMADERRIIYEFDVLRAYGMFGTPPSTA
jgi:PPOX class probable F420-dependent enzyme